ncbi:MAG: hypothetical protein ACRDYB_12740, partial [Acidimicrobiales bacterium]
MDPLLQEGTYLLSAAGGPEAEALARLVVREGVTVVLRTHEADRLGGSGTHPCERIALGAASDLAAVGFLAVAVTESGISDAFSKKVEKPGPRGRPPLHANFARPHQTLTKTQRRPTTPAMVAGGAIMLVGLGDRWTTRRRRTSRTLARQDARRGPRKALPRLFPGF